MISTETDPHADAPDHTDETLVADQQLAEAVEFARAALVEDVGAGDQIGDHAGSNPEPTTSGFALTHRFAATLAGYRGWHWAITIARAEDSTDLTVCESVLLPGDGAITVPDWLPWNERVRAEDMHPGDIMPSDPDDDRLAPSYLLSDDPAVEEVGYELGLGRVRVMSREGRLEAADRWSEGTFGSTAAMAKHAPGLCGTCGFFLPLAGSLRAAFGACGNELSPADGAVVIVDYGCGAHSEATISAEPEAMFEGTSVYNTADFDVVDARVTSGPGDVAAKDQTDADVQAEVSLLGSVTEPEADDAPLVGSVALDEGADAAIELDPADTPDTEQPADADRSCESAPTAQDEPVDAPPANPAVADAPVEAGDLSAEAESGDVVPD